VTFDPSLRPAVHFTARRNWLNDPNGLIWHDGEYHLFFQHNPEDVVWGNMSWGHAVSPDLLSWTELPLALRYDESEHVYSGCVVSDVGNTSGLGSATQPPLVAVYTSHDPDTRGEAQSLAVSLDRGRTWERYSGNPVLDLASSDFRDPKVFRYDGAWVMAVSLADKRVVRFYRSADLLTWDLLSDFGPVGSVDGVWECPDLIRVPIEGSDSSAWVLLVSVGDGAPAGGSGMQYFVGDFDGTTFTPVGEARWLDHGADFYAAISYSGLAEPVIHGWMSNWAYANEVPAGEFRGSMTLPRRLSLRESGPDLVLVQRPIELQPAGPSYVLDGVSVVGRLPLPVAHRSARITAEFHTGSAARVGREVRVGDGEHTVITVDRVAGTVSLDRSQSGVIDFHPGFAAVHSAPLRAGDVVRLEVYVDIASVEVFAGDGEVVLTDQIFPSADSTALAVFAEGGAAVLTSLEIAPLSDASCAPPR
jgi:fructan beta-fructosidase